MKVPIARVLWLGIVPIAASCATTIPHTASAPEFAAPVAHRQTQRQPSSGETTSSAVAPENETEALAKQLANPIASLISVPLQFNYDQDIGPSDGERTVLNVQPVIPMSLNEDWNLISRTILPIVDQNDIPAGNDESGLGDTVQSFFFSPVAPTASGWIWGAGPVLLIPTATDDTLGGEKWGIGPTGVALKQDGPWTFGALANHIWSVAGDDDRADVNATFVQPFVSYTTPKAWTYALNAEATYDWRGDELALPLNVVTSKVLKFGGQLVSIAGGLRYWAAESDAGPEGFGFRFAITFLFPKKS